MSLSLSAILCVFLNVQGGAPPSNCWLMIWIYIYNYIMIYTYIILCYIYILYDIYIYIIYNVI